MRVIPEGVMPNHPLASGLLCAALGLAAAETDAQPRPDFSGTWHLVPGRSEDVDAAVLAAAGPEHTQGGSKGEVDRVRFREWLLEVLDRRTERIVVIDLRPTEVEISLGDDVAIFYFGRESTRQSPQGERLRCSLRWEDDTLVAEEKGEKGTHIVRSFALLPDRGELVMALLWEAKPLRHPLNVRMVFARPNPAAP
jgi:hypothetical protein